MPVDHGVRDFGCHRDHATVYAKFMIGEPELKQQINRKLKITGIICGEHRSSVQRIMRCFLIFDTAVCVLIRLFSYSLPFINSFGFQRFVHLFRPFA